MYDWRAGQVLRAYDAQGDHRTGTAVDRSSAAWLADQVRDAGVEPRLEPFALARIEPHDCFLESDGHRLDGLPMFDGGFTPAAGLVGTLGPLGSDAAIALLASSPNGEYSPAFMGALAGSVHRAFVVMTEGALPSLAPVNAPRFSTPHDRPALMVSGGEADWLRGLVAQRARVRLVVRAARIPTTACNVTARINGREPAATPLVVMTPRSGWWNCASERGGGLVCWLAALRVLAADPPARTVRFTANSGHELGHLGLRHFQANYPEARDGAHVWLHFGANIGARGSGIVLQCATDALRADAEAALARAGLHADAVIGPEQAPAGEARNIHAAGGRYLSLLSRPSPVFHHPADRWPASVDMQRVATLAAALTEVALQLAAD